MIGESLNDVKPMNGATMAPYKPAAASIAWLLLLARAIVRPWVPAGLPVMVVLDVLVVLVVGYTQGLPASRCVPSHLFCLFLDLEAAK